MKKPDCCKDTFITPVCLEIDLGSIEPTGNTEIGTIFLLDSPNGCIQHRLAIWADAPAGGSDASGENEVKMITNLQIKIANDIIQGRLWHV